MAALSASDASTWATRCARPINVSASLGSGAFTASATTALALAARNAVVASPPCALSRAAALSPEALTASVSTPFSVFADARLTDAPPPDMIALASDAATIAELSADDPAPASRLAPRSIALEI